jgi:hypothetical protein
MLTRIPQKHSPLSPHGHDYWRWYCVYCRPTAHVLIPYVAAIATTSTAATIQVRSQTRRPICPLASAAQTNMCLYCLPGL